MRENAGKKGKIEEMFLSCPPGSVRLVTALCMLNIHIRDRPQVSPVSEIPSPSINVPIAHLATVRHNRTPYMPYVDIYHKGNSNKVYH